MKYNNIIENKLRLIEKKISDIESWQITSFKKFSENTLLQNAVERALQVSVEIMTDISERILAIEKIPPQDTSVDNFKKLEHLRIIKDADKYSDMIRFRNFIVHRYEYIDTEIVYGIVKNKLFLFRNFIDEIRKNK